MSQLSSDAIPFDIPETTESTKEKNDNKEETKEEIGKKNEKKESRKNKKKKRSKYYESESDTDSSDDDFWVPKNVGTYISINKGKNIHIGNEYKYTQINTAVSTVNFTDSASEVKSEYKYTETEKCLSEDLINSKREIKSEDIYKVAEHISTDWKKLARFLPPGSVFSEGKLRTFEENNRHDVEEAVVNMLNDWKDRYPEDATVGNLAKTLCKIKKSYIAEKLAP